LLCLSYVSPAHRELHSLPTRRSSDLDDYGVPADVLSVTSFNELRREALECERWNLLHPGEHARVPYVRQMLQGREAPVVAATDYLRAVPDQIRQWVGGRYVTLGTDGFGRSD